MENNNLQNNKIKFYIDAIARFCDRCGNAYTESDVQVISDNSNSSIIHFTCSNCKSRHIASFIKPIGISSRMPINTDLNIDEVSSVIASGKVVTTDDILEMYKTLKNSKSQKV